MELKCVPQVYEWGKKGATSQVAKLLAAFNKEFKIDDKVPFAELWMGTHPNGESIVAKTGETLSDYLKKNPKCMGTAETINAGDLPFLFKILSIEKALSIQVHPNKEVAERLNSVRPDLYPDKNHKPELAIALTDFECLVGFRPLDQIIQFLATVPELKNIFNRDVLDQFSGESPTQLAELFRALMTAPDQKVKVSLKQLVERLQESVEKVKEDSLYPLVEKLTQEFPNDVGCLAIYFLNYMKLKPGEAVFLHAGLPHAYLSGDIVECMACSDNVVRAGLTPKFRDVATLCDILDYKSYKPSTLLSASKKTDGITTVYNSGVRDFGVSMIDVPPSVTYLVPRQHSCSIIIVIEGHGESEQFK
ncbi:mannose-6-phosphate isomerase, partial [Nesidiocoris tenuis]